MRERPILFSGPLVRALLAGTKTQTRRIVKPQPSSETTLVDWNTADRAFVPWAWAPAGVGCGGGGGRTGAPFACPYGVPGDRLWVRETWTSLRSGHAHYRATATADDPGPWRPSIHMPRWASRISLEVTDVRVERLQAITEDDARAEGVEPHAVPYFAERSRYPWVWAITFRRVQP